MLDEIVTFKEEEIDTMLPYYKVKFKFAEEDYTRSEIVSSMQEFEQLLQKDWRFKNKKVSILTMTRAGKDIDELEEGDIVQRYHYGVYSTQFISKLTKYHYCLRGSEEKYKRKNGGSLNSEKDYLVRYDPEWIESRKKNVEWRKQVNKLKEVRWTEVKEETTDFIYALLVEEGIIQP